MGFSEEKRSIWLAPYVLYCARFKSCPSDLPFWDAVAYILLLLSLSGHSQYLHAWSMLLVSCNLCVQNSRRELQYSHK